MCNKTGQQTQYLEDRSTKSSNGYDDRWLLNKLGMRTASEAAKPVRVQFDCPEETTPYNTRWLNRRQVTIFDVINN